MWSWQEGCPHRSEVVRKHPFLDVLRLEAGIVLPGDDTVPLSVGFMKHLGGHPIGAKTTQLPGSVDKPLQNPHDLHAVDLGRRGPQGRCALFEESLKYVELFLSYFYQSMSMPPELPSPPWPF